MKTLIRFAKYLILAYCVTGLVYGVAGYIYRSSIGKQEVFSPLIGIPFDVISWLWMVYADLRHIGVGFQDVSVFISIALCIAVVIRKKLNLKKSMEKDEKNSV